MAFGDQVPNTFITQFEGEVKIAYGQAAKMRPAVRTVSASGKTVRFPTLLTKFAHQAKAAGADLTYNDPQHNYVDATMLDYYVPALIEEMDQLKTNVDLRGVYAQHIGNALAEIHDKNILTALSGWDAITSPTTTPIVVDTSDGDSVLDRLIDASAVLNGGNVPMANRTFVVKTSEMSNFLKNDKATSDDFNTVKALVNGTLNQYMGANWIMLPDSYFVDADTVGFLFHKDAVGAGVNSDLKVRVDWVPQKVAHQVLGTLSMGSKIIDAAGVVEIIRQA